MNNQYEAFATKRLSGRFGTMGSWRLVQPYLKNKKCLDIGCADGLYLELLQQGSLGIEQVPDLAESANAKGLNVIQGDAIETLAEFKEGEFEAVLFSHVMEHIESPISALRAIKRVLVPGGTLVLGLPIEKNIYRDLMNLDYFDGTHIYSFSIRNATKLLNECGFRKIALIYHLPKCRGTMGLRLLQFWNSVPIPFREYCSMAYWIIAEVNNAKTSQ